MVALPPGRLVAAEVGPGSPTGAPGSPVVVVVVVVVESVCAAAGPAATSAPASSSPANPSLFARRPERDSNRSLLRFRPLCRWNPAPPARHRSRAGRVYERALTYGAQDGAPSPEAGWVG